MMMTGSDVFVVDYSAVAALVDAAVLDAVSAPVDAVPHGDTVAVADNESSDTSGDAAVTGAHLAAVGTDAAVADPWMR